MNRFQFNCNNCENKCDGKSKHKYIFQNDMEYATIMENMLIENINKNNSFYNSYKTKINEYPDIIVEKDNKMYCLIEVKSQRRTFMKVAQKLSNSQLMASETLALNTSDLIRYIHLKKELNDIPIYILWTVENRPCICQKEIKLFYKEIDYITNIYNYYKDNRQLKREPGLGDYKNNKMIAATSNYHFSIQELDEIKLPLIIDKL